MKKGNILLGTNIVLDNNNTLSVAVPSTYEEYIANENYWYRILDQLARSNVGHLILRAGFVPYHAKISPPGDDAEVVKYIDPAKMLILDFTYVSHGKGYPDEDDGEVVYTMFKFGLFKSQADSEFWSMVEAYEYEVEETDIYYNIFIDPSSMIFIKFRL